MLGAARQGGPPSPFLKEKTAVRRLDTASGLNATLWVEDLMRDLAKDYTIVIVTHNMQQAARVSDMSAFFMTDSDRAGSLVEYGPTSRIFTNPRDKRTEDYITGRFG